MQIDWRHYIEIEAVNREHRPTQVWPADVLRWLAPRVMICGVLRSTEDNRAIAKTLKEAGVRELTFDTSVYEFWAARQIMHKVWDPNGNDGNTVLDLLELFHEFPETLTQQDKSQRQQDLEERIVGARDIYRRHLEYLLSARNKIEQQLRAYFD